KTSSTGLDRLARFVAELDEAGEEFASLAGTRRIDGAAAAGLRESLDACKRRRDELVQDCRSRAVADRAFARGQLLLEFKALIASLRERLEKVPLNQALPTATELERELQDQVFRIHTQIWHEMRARLQ